MTTWRTQIALAHPRSISTGSRASALPRPAAGPSRPRHAAFAQVLGAGAAGGRGRPRRRRPRDGRELRHRQRVLPGAPVRPSCRARARHGLLHLLQRGHCRPLRAQEIRRGAHRRRRLRRAPRQRHAGHLLDATRTSISAPRIRCRSIPAPARSRDGRRQRLECAAAARRRRRPVQGGLPESRILPRLRSFAPDIVLISAGFDAHQDDPLANLRLVEPDFAWATAKIADIAAKHAHGPAGIDAAKAATTSPRWRESVGVARQGADGAPAPEASPGATRFKGKHDGRGHGKACRKAPRHQGHDASRRR